METLFIIFLFFIIGFVVFIVKTIIYNKTFDSKVSGWTETLIVRRKKDNKIAAILWPWQYYNTMSGRSIYQEYSDYIPPKFAVGEAILGSVFAFPLLIFPIISCMGILFKVILRKIEKISSK